MPARKPRKPAQVSEFPFYLVTIVFRDGTVRRTSATQRQLGGMLTGAVLLDGAVVRAERVGELPVEDEEMKIHAQELFDASIEPAMREFLCEQGLQLARRERAADTASPPIRLDSTLHDVIARLHEEIANHQRVIRALEARIEAPMEQDT